MKYTSQSQFKNPTSTRVTYIPYLSTEFQVLTYSLQEMTNKYVIWLPFYNKVTQVFTYQLHNLSETKREKSK